MIPGIYCIFNSKNNRYYIGSSSVDITYRLKSHVSSLKRNAHTNSRLQTDFNLFGYDVFEFIILKRIKESRHRIQKLEFGYIKKFRPFYNIANKAITLSGTYEYRYLEIKDECTLDMEFTSI